MGAIKPALLDQQVLDESNCDDYRHDVITIDPSEMEIETEQKRIADEEQRVLDEEEEERLAEEEERLLSDKTKTKKSARSSIVSPKSTEDPQPHQGEEIRASDISEIEDVESVHEKPPADAEEFRYRVYFKNDEIKDALKHQKKDVFEDIMAQRSALLMNSHSDLAAGNALFNIADFMPKQPKDTPLTKNLALRKGFASRMMGGSQNGS